MVLLAAAGAVGDDNRLAVLVDMEGQEGMEVGHREEEDSEA